MKKDPPIAIYHKDCPDGTVAAAVFLKKFPEALVFPLLHSFSKEDVDLIVSHLSNGTTVYTLDCALGVEAILSRGAKVITIDHHIGMVEELRTLEKVNKNFTYIFDNEKSGASLSWTYFFPDTPMPEIIALVEDYDIWKWKFGEETKDANNVVSMYINKPEAVLSFLDGFPKEAKEKGAAITEYTTILLRQYVENMKPVMLAIGPYTVPAYDSAGTQSFKSEAGNILSKEKNCTVALFTINGSEVRLSFRGKDGQKPSSLELAKILGGGGHMLAAGASIPLPEFLRLLKIP